MQNTESIFWFKIQMSLQARYYCHVDRNLYYYVLAYFQKNAPSNNSIVYDSKHFRHSFT